MKEIAIKEEQNYEIVVKDIESMQNICTQLMKSKHYQAMGEAGLFAIVQKAKSLGIHPLEALNGGLYYVQGKVGMSSEMMASLIRQRGHSITKDPRSDNTMCILHGKRADTGDTWGVSFSMDDAKRAGLAKMMYDKYPGIMLYNRAMSMLARQLFPDIIKGAGYTKDELMEIKGSYPEKTDNYEIEPPKELISAEQAQELIDILSECEEEYQKQVLTFIRRPPISAQVISELPIGLYDRVRSAALKKREEARKMACEEITHMQEVQEEICEKI